VTELPSGLLLLNKPAGVTSFDCVQVAKRRFGAARAGHCGTLDPGARGLLLILLGSSTRLQNSFLGLEKEYWFRGQLGVKTSTADLEGPVVEKKPHDHVTEETLRISLRSFMGDTQQLPPMYSALKYKGKPYYHYARKGQDVPRVARTVSISSLELLSFDPPYWEARVICSRGTYVRTLVEDVAEELGTCATLVELVRKRIGPYRVTQALSWDILRTMDAASLKGMLQSAAIEAEPLHA
jgi:tRNA pseudouridine55 synthase